MLLALLVACADKDISLEDNTYDIERLSPIVIDVRQMAEQDSASVEVNVPALSTIPIQFLTDGTHYFSIVIEDGSGLRVTSTNEFGPVRRLNLNFRQLRYAVFSDPLVESYVPVIEATNETVIDGVKMYIGYSMSPEYLTTYTLQSGGSSRHLEERVTWRYSCTDKTVNGVKQPRVCSEYKR